jgi:hypothetical protein
MIRVGDPYDLLQLQLLPLKNAHSRVKSTFLVVVPPFHQIAILRVSDVVYFRANGVQVQRHLLEVAHV